jgi:hypothetical protein
MDLCPNVLPHKNPRTCIPVGISKDDGRCCVGQEFASDRCAACEFVSRDEEHGSETRDSGQQQIQHVRAALRHTYRKSSIEKIGVGTGLKESEEL